MTLPKGAGAHEEGLIGVDRGAEAGKRGADAGEKDLGLEHRDGRAVLVEAVIGVRGDVPEASQGVDGDQEPFVVEHRGSLARARPFAPFMAFSKEV